MSEWISVKDRLPKERDSYIVYGEYGVEAAGFYPDSGNWYALAEEKCCADELYKVTHWMEFPDPPKV